MDWVCTQVGNLPVIPMIVSAKGSYQSLRLDESFHERLVLTRVIERAIRWTLLGKRDIVVDTRLGMSVKTGTFLESEHGRNGDMEERQ